MIWTPSFPATLTTLGEWASLNQKLRSSGPKLEVKVLELLQLDVLLGLPNCDFFNKRSSSLNEALGVTDHS
jgi:hypothetical protein